MTKICFESPYLQRDGSTTEKAERVLEARDSNHPVPALPLPLLEMFINKYQDI